MILEIEQPSTLYDKIFIECLKERKIILNNIIDNSLYEIVCMTIRMINLEDDKNSIPVNERKPIEIYVNSYGGSTYDGYAAVNSILTSKTPVHTYCDGYAMSMGLAIFSAGHKRFAYPYTNFMYHEVSTEAVGKNVEIERVTKENKRIQKMYDSLITSHSSIEQKKLDKIKRDSFDWFFDAKEALAMGLVTGLIE